MADPEYQNLTLRVRRLLLRQAKVVAAKRGTSLSAMVTDSLEDAVRRDDEDYDRAMRSYLARKPVDLGFNGKVPWTREELHKR